MSGLNTGRFLDPSRIRGDARQRQRGKLLRSRRLSSSPAADSVHLNLNFTRSWFQTPNSFDDQQLQRAWIWSDCRTMAGSDPMASPSGPTDQRSQNQDLQHRADLDAPVQLQHRVHLGGLRASRPIQLLPERRSVRRLAAGSCNRNRVSAPIPHQRRRSRRTFPT